MARLTLKFRDDKLRSILYYLEQRYGKNQPEQLLKCAVLSVVSDQARKELKELVATGYAPEKVATEDLLAHLAACAPLLVALKPGDDAELRECQEWGALELAVKRAVECAGNLSK